jgi:cytochrome b involved in lipid metabolism
MAHTTSDKKLLTLAEVKQLATDKNKCILIINNRVYDVTTFSDEVCYFENIFIIQYFSFFI